MNDTRRKISRSSQFKKDVRLAHRQGRDIVLLERVITMLANDELLHDKYRDHSLSGNWKGYRECHVAPDWLLVYRKINHDELFLLLVRVASHNELDF